MSACKSAVARLVAHFVPECVSVGRSKLGLEKWFGENHQGVGTMLPWTVIAFWHGFVRIKRPKPIGPLPFRYISCFPNSARPRPVSMGDGGGDGGGGAGGAVLP